MTAEEAIESIEGIKSYYTDDRDFSYYGDEYEGLTDDDNEALDMAIKALEQTRWIPVSERLPESDEECHTFLVTDINGNVTLSDFYLSLSNSEPYWSGMINVIAWMSLPQPYKAESEGKECR